jgi:hypothetical protein
MIRFFLSATLLLVATSQAAAEDQCWRLGELKGYSSAQGNQFKFSEDGFGKEVYELRIGSNGGSISNAGVSCIAMSTEALLCTRGTDGITAIESWAVDSSSGKAFFTRNRTGSGPFNGTFAFVGRVLGTCKY